MKVVFVTNLAIFHQTGLWDEFVKQSKDIDFTYLATEKLSDERIKMHYKEQNRKYILYSHDLSEQQLQEIFNNVDFLIFAQTEDKRVLKYLNNIKNVFLPHEHIIKKITPRKLLAVVKGTIIFKKLFKDANRYVLAPSYQTYKEYSFTKLTSKDRFLKYGYFPKLECTTNKKLPKAIWAGRLIKWKHPETAIYFINNLNSYLPNYKVEMYGEGKLKEKIERLVKTNCSFHHFINNSELLEKMEESEIGLFTSDFGEGYGVVLPECMSKGCIVFANAKAGATKMLVEDGKNGFIYKNKKDLRKKIEIFAKMSNKEKQVISSNAMNTISETWNYKIAAERLYSVMKSISENKEIPNFKFGPLSRF